MPEELDLVSEVRALIATLTQHLAPPTDGAHPGTPRHHCPHLALGTALKRLKDLVGPPLPGRTFTLTYAGPERHDGEAPYSFVVNGEDLDDARRNLSALPFFVEWLEEQRPWDSTDDPDVVFLDHAAYSHSGLPSVGYNDLRREQAACLAGSEVTR